MVDTRDGKASASTSERMSERNRTAVLVDLGGVEALSTDGGDGLGSKGFVDFEEVNVILGHTSLLEKGSNGVASTHTHDGRTNHGTRRGSASQGPSPCDGSSAEGLRHHQKETIAKPEVSYGATGENETDPDEYTPTYLISESGISVQLRERQPFLASHNDDY